MNISVSFVTNVKNNKFREKKVNLMLNIWYFEQKWTKYG